MLTQELLKKHVFYDPETGKFTRIGYFDSWGNYVKKTSELNKYSSEGYLIVSIQGKRYKAHRLVFLYMNNDKLNDVEVDHIDGNRSNNKYSNLRVVVRTENMKNKGLYSNSSTGVIGVSQFNGRFRARINLNGKRMSLGLFDTIEEASRVRKEYEIKYSYSDNHGEVR